MAIKRGELANAKGLPEDVLTKAGVSDNGSFVFIRYSGMNGEDGRMRMRSGLKGSDSSWVNGDAPIIPYGLWLVKKMLQRHNYVVLVEGESDAWSCWHNDLPALGIPGANMQKCLQLEHIQGFPTLYIWQEPDDAGKTFVSGLLERLEEIDYKGKVLIIDPIEKGCKDANELFQQVNLDFEDEMEEFRQKAIPAMEWELETWEEPIPFHQLILEPLPVDVLPKWARDFAVSLAEFTQTPVSMALLLILSVMSTALANKGIITVRNGYDEPLIVWSVVVLPPASRKSAVFKAVIEPIFHFETCCNEQSKSERGKKLEQKDILEGRCKIMKKEAMKAESDAERNRLINEMTKLMTVIEALEIPPELRLIASDVTTEKIAQLMKDNHGRISVMSSEGEVFKLMAGRYSSTGAANFESYKKAWTGGEVLREDRMGRQGAYVKNPAITMGLTVQPSVIQDLPHKSTFVGEGLLGRFLYASPNNKIGRRKTGSAISPLNETAKNIYDDKMDLLLSAQPREIINDEFIPHVIEMSPEAKKVRDEFEAIIEAYLAEDGILSSIPDWGGKLVGQSIRIAGLLHLADQLEVPHALPQDIWDNPVSESAMRRAVCLANALIPHAKAVYQLMNTDRRVALAKYVLERIVSSADPSSITIRELHRMTDQKAEITTVDDLREPLIILEEHKLIRIHKRNSSGGRPPSPLIKVNPKYLIDRANKDKRIVIEDPSDTSVPFVPQDPGEKTENNGDNLDDQLGEDINFDDINIFTN